MERIILFSSQDEKCFQLKAFHSSLPHGALFRRLLVLFHSGVTSKLHQVLLARNVRLEIRTLLTVVIQILTIVAISIWSARV